MYRSSLTLQPNNKATDTDEGRLEVTYEKCGPSPKAKNKRGKRGVYLVEELPQFSTWFFW
jgi:hypothetical protein